MRTTTNKPKRIAVLGVLGVTALLTLLTTGCGNSETAESTTSTTSAASDAPIVSEVWARAAKAGGNTAIYMNIAGGSSADRLVEVKTPEDLGHPAEMHETTMVDDSTDSSAMPTEESGGMSSTDGSSTEHSTPSGGGMMTMQQVDGIDVPAGGNVALAPGGYHIMIMELTRDLVAGEEIPITLTFEKAGQIEAVATVKEP